MAKITEVHLEATQGSNQSIFNLSYTIIFSASEMPSTYLLTASLWPVDINGWISAPTADFTDNEMVRCDASHTVIHKNHRLTLPNTLLNEDKVGKDEFQAIITLKPVGQSLVADSPIITKNY